MQEREAYGRLERVFRRFFDLDDGRDRLEIERGFTPRRVGRFPSISWSNREYRKGAEMGLGKGRRD